jgi:hypothetical protein
VAVRFIGGGNQRKINNQLPVRVKEAPLTSISNLIKTSYN